MVEKGSAGASPGLVVGVPGPVLKPIRDFAASLDDKERADRIIAICDELAHVGEVCPGCGIARYWLARTPVDSIVDLACASRNGIENTKGIAAAEFHESTPRRDHQPTRAISEPINQTDPRLEKGDE